MSLLRKILGGKQRKLTKAEADSIVIEQLRKLGAKLNQPREVIHFLYLPTLDSSRMAAEALRSKGYETEEKAAANAASNPPNPFLVIATRQIVVDSSAVAEFRQIFEQLASFHNGEYDGWEACAQP
ncbi:MAG TPA: ribonuclease E inhibitor RraB [Candidatus Acidoferrales bacterium]|nr:ribonuclease E inhibitor RraB [Candidatus Acidoferrales bacterium]